MTFNVGSEVSNDQATGFRDDREEDFCYNSHQHNKERLLLPTFAAKVNDTLL